jgi:hypothetical protein
MNADVLDPFDAHHPTDVGRHAAAHASDERVALRQARHFSAGFLRHGGILRPLDDRSERPVDIEENSRLLGLGAKTNEQH